MPARKLELSEITSPIVQELIVNMRHTLINRTYGVGLAAPQVGHSLAASVIGIKPTPTRPDNPVINTVFINSKIISNYGKLIPKWEGCISFGSGRDLPYAQAMRYEKIKLRYYDESATEHETTFDGFLAHVIQHEVDHLEGILFVDKVINSTTFISISKYKKRYLL